MEDFRLTIYNRFGAKVFISSSQDDGWDGRSNSRDCQEGLYIWQIDYRNPQNKLQTIRGRVLLLR
ncbi:MAG: gliding motility-associated C-terminal domain-containing protein [Bacteroidetes bacterium]|nr:gliding motility-associated C-terminal domain-containing protein [Bacteroidota bacterium]